VNNKQKTIKETSVAHQRVGGHNHDGTNSTKVDFSKYTSVELFKIAELLKDAEISEMSAVQTEDTDAEPTMQIGDQYIADDINPPQFPTASTGVDFDVYERVWLDISWEEPYLWAPEANDYHQMYYWNEYYPSVTVSDVNEYEVAVAPSDQESIPDTRYRTKNTQIRIENVLPDTEYRYYIWAINSLNAESLYETGTVTSESIYNIISAGKRADLVIDGGFEDADTPDDWTFTTGGSSFTRSATESQAGSYSMLIAGTASTDWTALGPFMGPVVEGTYYDPSIWIHSLSGTLHDVSFRVRWYDSDQAWISTTVAYTLDDGPWSYIWLLMVSEDFILAPAGAAYARIEIICDVSVGTPSLYVDTLRFEQVSFADGMGWRTDSPGQTPHIAVNGHHAIEAPRANGTTSNPGGVNFYESEEPFHDLALASDPQLVTEIKAGPVDSTLSANVNPESATLRVVSRQLHDDGSGPSGTQQGIADVELTIDDDDKRTRSLPRGIVGMEDISATAGPTSGTGITYIKTISDVQWEDQRIYRFSIEAHVWAGTVAGDQFRIGFQINSTDRWRKSFKVPSSGGSMAPFTTGIWTSDLTGVYDARCYMQRISGTGTLQCQNFPQDGENSKFIVEDIGRADTDWLYARS